MQSELIDEVLTIGNESASEKARELTRVEGDSRRHQFGSAVAAALESADVHKGCKNIDYSAELCRALSLDRAV